MTCVLQCDAWLGCLPMQVLLKDISEPIFGISQEQVDCHLIMRLSALRAHCSRTHRTYGVACIESYNSVHTAVFRAMTEMGDRTMGLSAGSPQHFMLLPWITSRTTLPLVQREDNSLPQPVMSRSCGPRQQIRGYDQVSRSSPHRKMIVEILDV